MAGEPNLPLSDEQLNVAVEWWTQVLVNPSFKGTDRNSRELGNEVLELGTLTMTMATGGKDRYTPEQLKTFGAALRERLQHPNDFEIGSGWGLSIDYHPPRQLREALEAAGIRAYPTLPIKTGMSFRNGGVTVWPGYQSNAVVLLPTCPPPPPDPDTGVGKALAAARLTYCNPYITDGRFPYAPPAKHLELWQIMALRGPLELGEDAKTPEILTKALSCGRWDGGTLGDILEFAAHHWDGKMIVLAPGVQQLLRDDPTRYYTVELRNPYEEKRHLEISYVSPENHPYSVEYVLLRTRDNTA